MIYYIIFCDKLQRSFLEKFISYVKVTKTTYLLPYLIEPHFYF